VSVVAISCIADMDELLHELPLDRVTTSMTINATAPLLLAFYVAVADGRKTPRAALGGTVQNDVLKEYIARGTYIYPLAASLRLITDVFEFTAREVPQWNSISVSGYHMREAGSTAVQELAFTLANGLAYLDAARERKLDLVTIARRMSFFFNAHNHLFEEAAKFRAARKLWAQLLEERFGIRDAEARKLRFHTQTAGSMLTAQQPLNNVVRVAVQGLAAVLGGTQSLHTNSYDEALGLPSQESALLALRTQQVLAHESGATDTVDPLAGSYWVESLTAELEQRARGLMDEIAKRGGMLRAIADGWVQDQIHEAAYRWQRDVESGERVVVGVNQFGDDRPVPAPPFQHDPEVERRRSRFLSEWRGSRSRGACEGALKNWTLRRAAPRTWCRRSSRRSPRRPRSARSATRCGPCSACTSREKQGERKARQAPRRPADRVGRRRRRRLERRRPRARGDRRARRGHAGEDARRRSRCQAWRGRAARRRRAAGRVRAPGPGDAGAARASLGRAHGRQVPRDARPRPHHVSLEVTDIAAHLARAKAAGVRLIDEAPRPGAHGTQVAFLHPKSLGGVLVELCEAKRR
jgi:methylmalonyl-CoA mutase N-terminal domain/subunit